MVGWSVGNAFVKIDEKWTFTVCKMIYTVLDEEKRGTRRKEGRGGRRDEEEGGTRRKEGLGRRRDKEEGGTTKNEGRGGRRDKEEKGTRKKEGRRE